MKLCPPAIVYLVLSVIALIFNFTYSIKSALIHIVFIGLWTVVLNYICKKGFVWVSWMLVIIPYVFMALVTLIAVEFIALSDLQKQGLL